MDFLRTKNLTPFREGIQTRRLEGLWFMLKRRNLTKMNKCICWRIFFLGPDAFWSCGTPVVKIKCKL